MESWYEICMCCETFESNIIFSEWVWVLKKLSVPQVGYFLHLLDSGMFHLSMTTQATPIAWSHVSDKTSGVAQWGCWQSGGATGNAHWGEGLYTNPWQAGLSRQGGFKKGIVCVVTILQLSECRVCWLQFFEWCSYSGCWVAIATNYSIHRALHLGETPRLAQKKQVVVHWKGDERFFPFFIFELMSVQEMLKLN